MDSIFCKLFASILCFNLLQLVENASSNEALTECGNVHHIEMHNFPNAIASYRNSKCALVCAIGNDTLPVETLNQGKSCPEDTAGICHNGHCIGGVEDALLVCTVEHSLDFHSMKDHQGTAFTNSQCMLKCVISGKEWSVNHLHEGSPCPANPNGVCRRGECVTQSTNTGSTVTPLPTTITPKLPTNVTQPSTDSFSPSKMKLLNISLESSVPTLNHDQSIGLYFHETKQSKYISICFFNSNKPSTYSPEELTDIPNKLHNDSVLEIDLWENHNANEHYGDLYPIFSGFYQNRKLNFGMQENFDAKFAIFRKTTPNYKLMDVSLRFTIVFSKD